MVEKAWQIPVNGAECIQLLKRCERVRNDFILWNKSVFGVVKARIRILEDKLKKKKKNQVLAPTKENLELEAALNLKLNEWMEREELKWKKKFIELWLKMGGQNSKKISSLKSIRRRRNFILEIKLNSEE